MNKTFVSLDLLMNQFNALYGKSGWHSAYAEGTTSNTIMTHSQKTLNKLERSKTQLNMMTISIMTLSRMTLSTMTQSIMTLSIMTLSIMMLTMMTLSIMTLRIMTTLGKRPLTITTFSMLSEKRQILIRIPIQRSNLFYN